MSDCQNCGIEKACYYPYKPCDCVHQRKHWSKERRAEFDRDEAGKEAATIQINDSECSGPVGL